jgi:hypothetical protein
MTPLIRAAVLGTLLDGVHDLLPLSPGVAPDALDLLGSGHTSSGLATTSYGAPRRAGPGAADRRQPAPVAVTELHRVA